jgi:rRNA maturation endonuclease Nob1
MTEDLPSKYRSKCLECGKDYTETAGWFLENWRSCPACGSVIDPRPLVSQIKERVRLVEIEINHDAI